MSSTHLDPYQTALLIIDVQHGLFQQRLPIYKADQLLTNINHLIDRARAAGVPVFYIQHSGDPAMLKGTPAWQLHPSLHPKDTDIRLIKLHDNAFGGTHLDWMLKVKNINTLVITGLLTHACVKATSRGARRLKYNVVLVDDGHSNYSQDALRIIDKWNQKLGELGCTLLPAAEIEFV